MTLKRGWYDTTSLFQESLWGQDARGLHYLLRVLFTADGFLWSLDKSLKNREHLTEPAVKWIRESVVLSWAMHDRADTIQSVQGAKSMCRCLWEVEYGKLPHLNVQAHMLMMFRSDLNNLRTDTFWAKYCQTVYTAYIYCKQPFIKNQINSVYNNKYCSP